MARKIKLSRHFDENVRLVAGICRKCYEEHDDVKIIAVNGAFLRQLRKNRIRTKKWVPPRSPHNLVEESLHDPWALLVATIFLNKTSCFSARPLIDKFLDDHPDPFTVLTKNPQDLEPYFDNLGLRKRATQVWRMSHDFVHKQWRSAGELYGIGRYGEDAFRMFCLGDFSVEPQDRFLRIYRAWYLMRERQGMM